MGGTGSASIIPKISPDHPEHKNDHIKNGGGRIIVCYGKHLRSLYLGNSEYDDADNIYKIDHTNPNEDKRNAWDPRAGIGDHKPYEQADG